MPPTVTLSNSPVLHAIAVEKLRPSPFSLEIYGDPAAEIDDLIESIRIHGVLVPLVVATGTKVESIKDEATRSPSTSSVGDAAGRAPQAANRPTRAEWRNTAFICGSEATTTRTSRPSRSSTPPIG